jgi:hypothetical protein
MAELPPIALSIHQHREQSVKSALERVSFCRLTCVTPTSAVPKCLLPNTLPSIDRRDFVGRWFTTKARE